MSLRTFQKTDSRIARLPQIIAPWMIFKLMKYMEERVEIPIFFCSLDDSRGEIGTLETVAFGKIEVGMKFESNSLN